MSIRPWVWLCRCRGFQRRYHRSRRRVRRKKKHRKPATKWVNSFFCGEWTEPETHLYTSHRSSHEDWRWRLQTVWTVLQLHPLTQWLSGQRWGILTQTNSEDEPARITISLGHCTGGYLSVISPPYSSSLCIPENSILSVNFGRCLHVQVHWSGFEAPSSSSVGSSQFKVHKFFWPEHEQKLAK